MKHLLLTTLLILPMLCFGQKDYCKKIKKTTDDNGVTTFKSPDLKHMGVMKQFKDNVYFGLLLHLNDGMAHFDATGVSVAFEDGTAVKDDNIKVICQQDKSEISSGYSGTTTSHSGMYQLQCFLPITDGNAEQFATKKIVTLSLHNVAQKVPEKEAVLIMEYVKCLRNVKP